TAGGWTDAREVTGDEERVSIQRLRDDVAVHHPPIRADGLGRGGSGDQAAEAGDKEAEADRTEGSPRESGGHEVLLTVEGRGLSNVDPAARTRSSLAPARPGSA